MANTVNYATLFMNNLVQKYQRELRTAGLMTQNVRFIGGKTIKIPFINVGGYKMHTRDKGFNLQDLTNDWMTKELGFDRDVEFYVDEMDVDETNYALTAANVTNVFLTEQAIPEQDAYNMSKLYSEYTTQGGTPDTTVLTVDNILPQFDALTLEMDDANVPQEGRLLYTTPQVKALLKSASGLSRSLNVGNSNDTAINRTITALDNTLILDVPSARMKTAYDFTNGWTPGAGAKQINMVLVAPSAILATIKHSYIRLWPEGTHQQGDGWLYQNRKYGDLFVLPNRIDGVKMNVEA